MDSRIMPMWKLNFHSYSTIILTGHITISEAPNRSFLEFNVEETPMTIGRAKYFN